MKERLQTTSFSLHILAMGLMLCDHVWGLFLARHEWLTCIGRLSFPIFAFMIVEGYFHTKDLKKYLLRILVFAIISEIPFNLAIGGSAFHPMHQNVLWSFLISLGLIHWNESVRKKGKLWASILVGLASVVIGYVVGVLTMVDYYHAGIFMALVFYFFRGRNWWQLLGQLVCLWYINDEILGGYTYEFQLLGRTWFFHRQAFAVLALIPIWLYRGKQGHHSKAFRYLCYGFYPAHLLLFVVIRALL